MRKRTTAAVAIAVIIVVVAGILAYVYSGAPTSSSKRINLTVGMGTQEGDPLFIPFLVAQQYGYFAKNGLNVSAVYFSGGQGPALRQMSSGSFDILFADILAVPQASSSGLSLKAIGAYDNGPYWVVIVPPGSKITMPSQLRDGTLAVTSPGSASYLWYLMFAKAQGFTPGVDVKSIYTGSLSAEISTVLAGKATAAVINVGGAVQAVVKYNFSIIYEGRKDYHYPEIAWLATPKILNNQPSVVRSFLKGYYEAAKFVVNNQTFAYQYAKKLGLTQNAAKILYDIASFSITGRFDPNSLSGVAQFAVQGGTAKSSPPIADWYTFDYLSS